MKAKRITTLEELERAAHNKRAVYSTTFASWPRPAAFVLNYAGSVLLSLFRRGLFIYKK